MSHAQKIRDALTQPRMTAAEILAASGLDKKQFQQAMGQMVHDGHVLIDREVWPRVYSMGRAPEPRPQNGHALRAWNEKRRLSRETKLERRKTYDRTYVEKRRASKTIQRLEQSISVLAAKAKTAEQVPVSRIETYEEYLKRGGVVQTLNPWDVSPANRLKGRYAS